MPVPSGHASEFAAADPEFNIAIRRGESAAIVALDFHLWRCEPAFKLM